MTDHLPECPWAHRGYAFPCICDRLRACEQRVFQEQIKGRQHDMVMAYLRGLFSYKGDIDTAYGQGWNEALDAAREAVAGVLHWSEGELGLICNWNSACDAIDALRGES